MNRFYFFLALLSTVAMPQQALAHGANIEYQETSAITIQAKYDDGTPMANAQVVVYAPSDRATPWLKGTTDESGNFTFIPDRQPENLGNWDIKVRQSGHGDITSIPITNDLQAGDKSQVQSLATKTGYNPMQKMVIAAAGVWGFVGTALFFSRKSS